MHRLWSGQPIYELIEQMTTIEVLPKNITFVASLRGTSILPMKALLTDNCIANRCRSVDDLFSLCEKSPSLSSRILCCPDPCIVLSFFVDPTIMIISQIPEGTNMRNLRNFIESLIGHNFFEIHPYSPNGQFKLRFADIQTAISVWRGLKYVNFLGNWLECTPLSSITPLQELPKLNPSPKRKKRPVSERKKSNFKNKLEMQINAKKKKKELSGPAALPMALKIQGFNDVPQAVLLNQRKIAI